AADAGLDALDRRRGALHGGHARDVPAHRRRPDLVAVAPGPGVAVGGVEHHVDLTGTDRVDRTHLPAHTRLLEVFAHLEAGDAVAAQHLGGALGGQHPEPE